MDHSKYGTGENKKTGEVMEVQVRLSGINANEAISPRKRIIREGNIASDMRSSPAY